MFGKRVVKKVKGTIHLNSFEPSILRGRYCKSHGVSLWRVMECQALGLNTTKYRKTKTI